MGICFLCSMCKISIPEMMVWADLKLLNPSIGRQRFLMNLWSCSTILFLYWHWRILNVKQYGWVKVTKAAVLALLLSMLMVCGEPFWCRFCLKNLRADFLLRCWLNMKSRVHWHSLPDTSKSTCLWLWCRFHQHTKCHRYRWFCASLKPLPVKAISATPIGEWWNDQHQCPVPASSLLNCVNSAHRPSTT